LNLISQFSLGIVCFGVFLIISKHWVLFFVRNHGKTQNPSFSLSVVKWKLLCLTLRLSYGLVLLVNGLSNGTL
jgi:hypothetical protein